MNNLKTLLQNHYTASNVPTFVIGMNGATFDRVEAMARAGYEFTAREKYIEGMFSTPLSDTVGLRLAAFRRALVGSAPGFEPTRRFNLLDEPPA